MFICHLEGAESSGIGGHPRLGAGQRATSQLRRLGGRRQALLLANLGRNPEPDRYATGGRKNQIKFWDLATDQAIFTDDNVGLQNKNL